MNKSDKFFITAYILSIVLGFSIIFGGLYIRYHDKNFDRQLHEKCIYPTGILLMSDDKYIFTGTCFVVKSQKIADNKYYNVIITASHVLDQYVDNRFRLRYHKYTMALPIYNKSTLIKYDYYPVMVKANYEKEDLAVLHFISPRQLYAADINYNPRLYMGNDVFHVGAAGGQCTHPRLDYGKITATDIYGEYRTSILIIPGDSGSPIYNTDYQLVGIATSSQRVFHYAPQISYATKSSRIKKKDLD